MIWGVYKRTGKCVELRSGGLALAPARMRGTLWSVRARAPTGKFRLGRAGSGCAVSPAAGAAGRGAGARGKAGDWSHFCAWL